MGRDLPVTPKPETQIANTNDRKSVFLFGSAWKIFLDLLLQLSQLLLHLDKMRASKSTNKRAPFGCRKKIPTCKNSFKKHDFVSLYLLRLLGLLLPFQLSLKSFVYSIPCQHMSTMFHQGPSRQQFISFFRQLGTWEKWEIRRSRTLWNQSVSMWSSGLQALQV